MSMTRYKIEAARKMAQDFIYRCDDALNQLETERRGWRSSGSTEAQPASPNDHSYGSKRTGTLRRRSMDLTRMLAELRK